MAWNIGTASRVEITMVCDSTIDSLYMDPPDVSVKRLGLGHAFDPAKGLTKMPVADNCSCMRIKTFMEMRDCVPCPVLIHPDTFSARYVISPAGFLFPHITGGLPGKKECEDVGAPAYIRASTKVPALAGMTAVKRGPLVYCFEGVDNGCVRALRLDRSALPEISGFNDKLGAVTLKVRASHVADCDGLYSAEPEVSEPFDAIAVPYYTWGNRGENEMRVWIP